MGVRMIRKEFKNRSRNAYKKIENERKVDKRRPIVGANEKQMAPRNRMLAPDQKHGKGKNISDHDGKKRPAKKKSSSLTISAGSSLAFIIIDIFTSTKAYQETGRFAPPTLALL